VIGVIENQAPTQALTKTVEVADGQLVLDRATDLAKVALVERHQGTGEVQLGLVTGFGFDLPCAVASTVAHDSHHMLVVGTDDESMVVAANRLAEVGGGQIVVRRGEPIALIELPIAGLMSDQRAEVVAAQAEALLAALRACGCQLNNANMQLSLLALVVIPALRISDKGLVDVDSFRVVPVIAGERE
jgi:adenine deaminase